MNELSEREKMLSRVKEALRVSAPRPGQAHPSSAGNGAPPAAQNAREWLPKVGKTPEAQLEAFCRIATDLKAEIVPVADRNAMVAAVHALRSDGHWQSIATHSGDLTTLLAGELRMPTVLSDKGYDKAALEKCSAGLTECDALVAQTGSVLVTAASAGGRALSVLPPHHVVLAKRSQLLPDLPEAIALLRRKYAGRYPSFISFITGPSRTGDIERILVLGAHGPKRLTIVLLHNE